MVVLLCLVAAGLVLGIGLVDEPEMVVPLSLEFLALLGVTAVVLRGMDPAARAFLVRVSALAIVARVGAMLVVYGVLSPEFFAPDVATYEVRGEALRRGWAGLGEIRDFGWQSSYIYLNAWSQEFFGSARYGLPVLNLFVGVWTALLAYALGRECFGEGTGKTAGVLVAIFPSLVLWSVLNIRDALATFMVTLAVLLAVRLYRRVRGGEVLLLVLSLVLLSTLRDYLAILALAGILLGWALALRPGRALPTMALGLLVGLGGVFFLERFELLSPDILEDPLSSVASLRQGLQQDFRSGLAGSAYGLEHDTSTLGGAIRYLPLGLAYFLFSPFPWAISSILQTFTLPEVLLWYALVPFTVVGMLRMRGGEGSAALLLLGVLALVVSSYALVEGNFGTAYRHRSQVLPLFFVFAGRGLTHWWELRRARARGRWERRLEAQAAAMGSSGPGGE